VDGCGCLLSCFSTNPGVENTQMVLVTQACFKVFQREEKIRPNNLSRLSLQLLSLAA